MECDIESIYNNEFSIDSLYVELINTSTGTSHTINGVGSLFQDKIGVLNFKVFAPNETTTFEDVISRASSKRIDKYKIKFKDTKGQIWETNEFYNISSFRSCIEKGHIYEGKLDFITSTSTNETNQDIIIFRVPEKIKIPINRQKMDNFSSPLGLKIKTNHFWLLEDEDLEIHFLNNKNFTDFYCIKKSQNFNSDFSLRFEKTIEFVLAQPLDWIISVEVVEKKEITTIRSKPTPSLIPRRYPPLKLGINCNDDDLKNLFLKYFSYISKEKSKNSITSLTSQVIKARYSDLYIESLVHSVSVETLITNFIKRIKVKDFSLEEDLKTLENKISSLIISKVLKNRIIGMISIIKSKKNTPKDTLRILLEENIIKDVHLKSWTFLRNKSAHGSLDKVDSREIINHNYNIIQLFHLLIFHLIDYKGTYKDYSSDY